MREMRVGSLFSGIGGLELGLERAGMQVVWQCEIDEFCRKVLKKHWPGIHCYEDVRKIDKTAPAIDLLCGGFPCQPHSVAGKRRGKDDERNLWPECIRLVRLLRPRWCLFENVPGLLTTMFGEVCDQLRGADYEVWPLVLGADDVGAPHRRKRVWIVAKSSRSERRPGQQCQQPKRFTQRALSRNDVGGGDSDGLANASNGGCKKRAHAPAVQGRRSKRKRQQAQQGHNGELSGGPCGLGGMAELGNSTSQRCQGAELHRISELRQLSWPSRPGKPQHDWEAPRLVWPTQPGLGSSAHGLSRRLARRRREQLKALGNSVVPLCAEVVGRAIMFTNSSRA